MPTCKRNLMEWLSTVCEEMNQKHTSEIVRMWAATKLTKAWDRDVQAEALTRAVQGALPKSGAGHSCEGPKPGRGRARERARRTGGMGRP